MPPNCFAANSTTAPGNVKKAGAPPNRRPRPCLDDLKLCLTPSVPGGGSPRPPPLSKRGRRGGGERNKDRNCSGRRRCKLLLLLALLWSGRGDLNSGPPDLGEKQRSVTVGWSQSERPTVTRWFRRGALSRSGRSPRRDDAHPTQEKGVRYDEIVATAAGRRPAWTWGDGGGNAGVHDDGDTRPRALVRRGLRWRAHRARKRKRKRETPPYGGCLMVGTRRFELRTP